MGLRDTVVHAGEPEVSGAGRGGAECGERAAGRDEAWCEGGW